MSSINAPLSSEVEDVVVKETTLTDTQIYNFNRAMQLAIEDGSEETVVDVYESMLSISHDDLTPLKSQLRSLMTTNGWEIPNTEGTDMGDGELPEEFAARIAARG